VLEASDPAPLSVPQTVPILDAMKAGLGRRAWVALTDLDSSDPTLIDPLAAPGKNDWPEVYRFACFEFIGVEF
jgi:hypothetical protein